LRRMDAHWRLARHYGIANMLIFHKLTDLDNVGDSGSAMRALASSLLANAETRVVYRQESDQLGATSAALGLTGTEQSLIPTLIPMPQPTSKARLVITALFVDHQTPAQVAARYGVHRAWVYKLKARYEAEGETALEPRSRRPETSPAALSPEAVDLIVRVRKELTDAGPETIAWHLEHHHGHRVARSTISRHLTAAGLVTPEPKKRPKSSYIRFQASMPNETWQSDFTHFRLTHPDGRPATDVEIISWLDDCTRYALHVTAHARITTPILVTTFRQSLARHGIPASTLTDNGMVYTVRLAGHGRQGGKNSFEAELSRRHIVQKNSRPGHPTTSRAGRAFSTDHEEVAASPTRPTEHHR
ncbi:MAG: helix-turn-helix domain-containing protein, partial [Nocardioidaceae bacterium]